MTAKEYLEQAYHLDLMIDCDIREVERLRALVTSLSSPGFEERVLSSGKKEPPFVRSIEKIMLMEEKINAKVDTLVDLKEQIQIVINAVEDPDERAILFRRYTMRKSWRTIAAELYADPKTIRKRHASALKHVVLPENPITIQKNLGNA